MNWKFCPAALQDGALAGIEYVKRQSELALEYMRNLRAQAEAGVAYGFARHSRNPPDPGPSMGLIGLPQRARRNESFAAHASSLRVLTANVGGSGLPRR